MNDRGRIALAIATLLALAACEGGAPNAAPTPAAGPAESAASAPSDRAAGSIANGAASGAASGGSSGATPGASSADDRRPAAIWNDVVVEWSDLRPRLAERGGGAVLEEMLLDRRLEQNLRERRITLTADQIAAEERILLETLDPSSERAATLLRELRQVQGLGPKRWSDLLRRNAALRALVAGEVQVNDESVTAALDAAHGPKRICRIIAAPDVRSADSIAARAAGGASFADLAVENSTDRSAERGGLLEPISRLDPSYPASFRNALWALSPGQVSAPVLLDRAWVVILFEREVPASSGINDSSAREKARVAVRRAQERLLMENYARSILRDATNPTIFDDALLESWRASRAAGDLRR